LSPGEGRKAVWSDKSGAANSIYKGEIRLNGGTKAEKKRFKDWRRKRGFGKREKGNTNGQDANKATSFRRRRFKGGIGSKEKERFERRKRNELRRESIFEVSAKKPGLTLTQKGFRGKRKKKREERKPYRRKA